MAQRHIRFQYDGEISQIIASRPNQCAGSVPFCEGVRVRAGVLNPIRHHQRIRRG
jgi:hypothetical protein